ncbi:MAG: hypothetical protein ACRC62_04590 [Microcoleus sp.]
MDTKLIFSDFNLSRRRAHRIIPQAISSIIEAGCVKAVVQFLHPKNYLGPCWERRTILDDL